MQRILCTMFLPENSWALFLDDDILRIHFLKDEREQNIYSMTLHDLIMFGFLWTSKEKCKLWGINTSMAPRNMRDTISRKLGLINGYFFGVITEAKSTDVTSLKYNDQEEGAAEDIERSLRSYCGNGIVRLNFACAVSRVWTNPGGLQSVFNTQDRLEAHNRVITKLCAEFTKHLELATERPNGCRFLSDLSTQKDAGKYAGNYDSSCESDESDMTSLPKVSEEVRIIMKERKTKLVGRSSCNTQSQSKMFECPHCTKTFTRKASLQHHILYNRARTESQTPRDCIICGP